MRALLTIYISIILFLIGCDTKPDTCGDQSARRLKIGFYGVTVSASAKTINDSTLRSFRAQFTSRPDTNVDTIASLPLAQNLDTSMFSVIINGNKNTVLYAVYKRNRIFENYTCGFRTNFVLDTVYTKPRICDSIIIVQPNITDVSQENCRFYLNTDSTVTYP